jgi:hypothetical protein
LLLFLLFQQKKKKKLYFKILNLVEQSEGKRPLLKFFFFISIMKKTKLNYLIKKREKKRAHNLKYKLNIIKQKKIASIDN